MKTKICKSCNEEISGIGCKNCVIHVNYLIVMIVFFLLAILYYCSLLVLSPNPNNSYRTSTYVINRCGPNNSCDVSTQYIKITNNVFQMRKIHYTRHNHRNCKCHKLKTRAIINNHNCKTKQKAQQRDSSSFQQDLLRLQKLKQMQKSTDFIEL